MSKRFALIGAGGYVAPRHMKAIKETGHQLVACLDKNDSVGIIDSYFPNAAFFTEFERFDRHLSKLIRNGQKLDYLVVCSPNYLHDAHIRFGLRLGCNVICEKPLVLNPWNVATLKDLEKESGCRVYTILQLRLHPSLRALKEEIDQSPPEKVFEVDLTYITSRGNWYYASWKASLEKSGGIATNIGIHFFDMLNWLFGDIKQHKVHLHAHDRASGYIELKKARVKWFLSINYDTLPDAVKVSGARTFRSITIDGKEVEFSGGFTDLHTLSYQDILDGKGFALEIAEKSIEIVYQIRNSEPIGWDEQAHALAKLPPSKHPFNTRNGKQPKPH